MLVDSEEEDGGLAIQPFLIHVRLLAQQLLEPLDELRPLDHHAVDTVPPCPGRRNRTAREGGLGPGQQGAVRPVAGRFPGIGWRRFRDRLRAEGFDAAPECHQLGESLCIHRFPWRAGPVGLLHCSNILGLSDELAGVAMRGVICRKRHPCRRERFPSPMKKPAASHGLSGRRLLPAYRTGNSSSASSIAFSL